LGVPIKLASTDLEYDPQSLIPNTVETNSGRPKKNQLTTKKLIPIISKYCPEFNKRLVIKPRRVIFLKKQESQDQSKHNFWHFWKFNLFNQSQ